MRVVWTAPASRDLEDIGDYVAIDDRRTARALVKRIEGAVRRLADHPALGRPGRISGTRELVISGTPYIVPYRVHQKQVEILAVYHSSRQWPDSFD